MIRSRHKNRAIGLLLLCPFLFGVVSAQTRIGGSVLDAENDFALAGAHVRLIGTGEGTITNLDGRFLLQVTRFPTRISVRFLGYKTWEQEILSPVTDVVIRLERATVQLDELVVTAEDPAVAIMREVIRRKQIWRQKVKNTKTNNFSRFVLEGPSGIVQIVESFGESYWKPNHVREWVIAERTIPDRAQRFLYATTEAAPNFYDDEFTLRGRTYIGPTHPDAVRQYSFRIGTRRVTDEDNWVDIYLTPTDGYSTALRGKIVVRLSDYAMVEAELRPDSFPSEPPIRGWEESYRQQFDSFGRDGLFPVDFHREGYIDLGVPGARYPRAEYRQTNVFSAMRTNVEVPDSMFSDSRTRWVEPDARRRSDYFYRTSDLLPMTDAELGFFLVPGNNTDLASEFRPEGLLAGYAAIPLVEKGEIPNRAWTSWRGRPTLWYNRVDGAQIGYQKRFRWAENQQIQVATGLDTGSKRIRYEIAAELPILVKRGVSAELGMFRGTDARVTSRVYPRLMTGLSAILGWPDYYDYFLRKGFSGALRKRFRAKLPVIFTTGISLENQASVSRTSDYEGFLTGNGQRENPDISEGRVARFFAKIGIGDDLEKGGIRGKKGVLLEAGRTIPSGTSTIPAHSMVRVEAVWQIATFFRREDKPNWLSIRISAAGTDENAPIQSFSGLDAALGFGFIPFGAFASVPNRPPEGTSHAGLFWEHDFGSVLFKVLGIWRWVDRGTGLVLYGAHGRTWLSSDVIRQLEYPVVSDKNFRHELGVSITNIFGFPVRLSAGCRMDSPPCFVGGGLSRRF